MDKPKKPLAGTALIPNAGIALAFQNPLIEALAEMHSQVSRVMLKVFTEHVGMDGIGMDANPASQARIALAALSRKWDKRFAALSNSLVDRMIDQTLKHSTATLESSLKVISEQIKVRETLSDPAVKTVIQASTQQAAQLIKLIPAEYLGKVQGEVMRALTTGRGQADLIPFFTKEYNGRVKWARQVALDQTRKAYSTINRVRLEKVGVKRYEWLHSGGAKEPRKDHIAMNGKIFEYNNPPVIDQRTGERGNPGDAINCRCVAKPIFDFDLD